MPQSYKLIYTVPHTHLAVTKEAIFAAGGGVYAHGKYINVSFEVPGNGQFIPVSAAGAKPHTGEVDKLERTQEMKVEIRCTEEEVVKKAVEALKKWVLRHRDSKLKLIGHRNHPYEEVAYEVFKIENF
jgi:hypothetical protein